MRELPRYLIAIAIGGLAFGFLRFLSPLQPEPETARLECDFSLAEQAAPVRIPYSQSTISKIRFVAELSNKSIHDDIVLWSVDGDAEFEGGSRELSGVVFTSRSDQVRGLGFRRIMPSELPDHLQIVTLNEQGILDWDEKTAFVYFDGSPDKLAHPFDYHCQLSNKEGQ